MLMPAPLLSVSVLLLMLDLDFVLDEPELLPSEAVPETVFEPPKVDSLTPVAEFVSVSPVTSSMRPFEIPPLLSWY